MLDDISFSYGYRDLQKRVHYAQKSLAVREKSGDLFGTAGVLGNLVVSQFWSGKFDPIISYIERALDIARQTNDVRNLAWQYVYLAEVCLFQGRLAEAMSHALSAEKIAQDIYDADLSIQVNVNKATTLALLEEDYLQARQILENTVPVDADITMHKANATMAYGLVAAGLDDKETLHYAASFPFEASEYKIDFGPLGLTWFSPIILADLFHREKYVPAAECLGFTLEKGMITLGFIESWSVLEQIVLELKAILGEQDYLAAIERGKTMQILDFQPYILDEDAENHSN